MLSVQSQLLQRNRDRHKSYGNFLTFMFINFVSSSDQLGKEVTLIVFCVLWVGANCSANIEGELKGLVVTFLPRVLRCPDGQLVASSQRRDTRHNQKAWCASALAASLLILC